MKTVKQLPMWWQQSQLYVHSWTRVCVLTFFYSAATRKQECVHTAVFFSCSGLSGAAQPRTIILFTRWIRVFMGCTAWKCLNLASIGVGKFHENWGKKKCHDHIDLHLGKVPKGDCNWNSCSRWNRSTTRTNSWWPQRDHGPLQITCAVDGAAST